MMSKKIERQKHQSLFRTCGVRDNAKWSTLWRVEGTFFMWEFQHPKWHITSKHEYSTNKNATTCRCSMIFLWIFLWIFL